LYGSVSGTALGFDDLSSSIYHGVTAS
jgi:hypothetical protein